MSFVIFILSLIGLIIGAQRLIAGTSALGYLLGIPQIIIGLTFVATAVSLPQIQYDLLPAIDGASNLTLYQVSNSNIANLCLVLGLILLIRPISISHPIAKKSLLFLMAGIVAMCVTLLDNKINRPESIVFLAGLFVGVAWLIWQGKQYAHRPVATTTTDLPIWQALLSLTIGLIILFLSATYVIFEIGGLTFDLELNSVISLAITPEQTHGINPQWLYEAKKGLIFIAKTGGQALPELAIALVALRRKEPDLLLGCLIGSNILNLFVTLPLPSLLQPTILPNHRILIIGLFQLLATGLVYLFIRSKPTFTRLQGGILVTCFMLYAVLFSWLL